jgi:hypothetical protein
MHSGISHAGFMLIIGQVYVGIWLIYNTAHQHVLNRLVDLFLPDLCQKQNQAM